MTYIVFKHVSVELKLQLTAFLHASLNNVNELNDIKNCNPSHV